MNKTAIFIDGAYLDKVRELNFGKAKIEYTKLIRKLAGSQELLRVYYYHCLPYLSNPPSTEESDRFARMRSFLNKINLLPRFEVRLGKLEFRGYGTNKQAIFEQEKVDVMMSVDLLLLSVMCKIDRAIVIAGDSDFIPAIEVAKGEGVIVTLYHGSNPHDDLVQACDESHQFDAEFIRQVAP